MFSCKVYPENFTRALVAMVVTFCMSALRLVFFNTHMKKKQKIKTKKKGTEF